MTRPKPANRSEARSRSGGECGENGVGHHVGILEWREVTCSVHRLKMDVVVELIDGIRPRAWERRGVIWPQHGEGVDTGTGGAGTGRLSVYASGPARYHAIDARNAPGEE